MSKWRNRSRIAALTASALLVGLSTGVGSAQGDSIPSYAAATKVRITTSAEADNTRTLPAGTSGTVSLATVKGGDGTYLKVAIRGRAASVRCSVYAESYQDDDGDLQDLQFLTSDYDHLVLNAKGDADADLGPFPDSVNIFHSTCEGFWDGKKPVPEGTPGAVGIDGALTAPSAFAIQIGGAATGTPIPPVSTEPDPTPYTCSGVHFLGVRGSGEVPQDLSLEAYESAASDGRALPPSHSSWDDPSGFGTPVDQILGNFLDQADQVPALAGTSIAQRAIAYPAIPVDLADSQYIDRYQRSVAIGANNLRTELRDIKVSCPNTKVVVAGYSQGADVINAAMALEQRANQSDRVMDQVRKIVFLGDPSHLPGRTENVGAGRIGVGNGSGASVAAGIANDDAIAYKNAHPALVSSICTIGDIVCDTSSGNLRDALAPVTGIAGNHSLYPSTKMKCPAVADNWQLAPDCAAEFLIAGIGYAPVARPNSGPTATEWSVNVGDHVYAGIVAVPVAAGGAVVEAGKTVEKWLHGRVESDPIDLGVFELDEQGRGIIEFDVPSVAPGQHHLKLVASDGRTYTVPIYVTDEPVNSQPTVFVIDGSTPDVQAPSTDPEPSNPGFGSSGSTGSLFGS